MDFIEQIFGISPDGGSGVIEFLLFLIPLLGVYLVHRLRSGTRRPKR
jgi:hypothetical protein